jgi:hypothetical protein
MFARDKLQYIQYIIGHPDVWRNIYQHELWHNIYRDDVYVHDYDDVYVHHHDSCSGACAYVLEYYYGNIYVHDGVNNDGRRNHDNKLFVSLYGQHADF